MKRRSFLLTGLGLMLLAAPALEAQSLRGSPTSVDRIYRQALEHGLHFYETSAGVKKAAMNGRFVELTSTNDYRVHNVSYPYVLPSTRTFVERLARQYRGACGEQLVVTSGIRPKSLRLVNSVDRSVHPTGMAVDLRKPTNGRCLSWLRATLLYLDQAGTIDAVEERRPPHFHVAVFPSQYVRYVEGKGGKVPAARVAAAPSRYEVRPGDSLWAIARRNEITVEKLKAANNLKTSRIVAGQTLVIPDRK